MVGEVHDGLTGGIAAANDIDVFAQAVRRLRRSGTVEQARSQEPVLAVDPKTAVVYAGRADIGLCDHA